MLEILYSLLLFPVELIISVFYMVSYRVLVDSGLAILGISLIVSILTLPLYFMAEKLQCLERDTQKRMKPDVDSIKAAFKGDEKFMLLSTYYRQNGYHPLYSLRSSISLIIQIPFFIVAFNFISNLEIIKGQPFLFINDLSSPDRLLWGQINLLPVLMTIINIISGIIYTKGLPAKEKFQIFGMAFIFLVILYNSPSALVIYWTMNNIFSLVKNILQKVNNSKKIIIVALFPVVIAFIIYLIFIHPGNAPKRHLTIFIISAAYFIPVIFYYAKNKFNYNFLNRIFKDNSFPVYFFIMSCIVLFLLNGFIIPSSLIVSSTAEFSFIGTRTAPFPFIFNTITKAAGLFLIYLILLFYLVPKNYRYILNYIIIIFTGITLVNTFLIFENFGFLTTTMIFSEPKPFSLIPHDYIINIVLMLIIVIALFLLLYFNKQKIIATFLAISIVSLLMFGFYNLYKINKDFIYVNEQFVSHIGAPQNYQPHYTFSKEGKNILIIMLDCVPGNILPLVMDEKPELLTVMEGFHWYPNTASFAGHTLCAAPPIYGGYEYTPAAVNLRDNVPLFEKQKQAYLLLPKIFSDKGYSVTVTDPPFDNYQVSNLAVFEELPQVKAENIIGKYTKQWLQENDDITALNITRLLDDNLIRFSLFKGAPLFLRLFIYDKGKWLNITKGRPNQLTDTVINDYAFLDSLDKITAFNDSGDTFISIYAHLPHEEAFLQAPDYVPVNNVTNWGNSILATNGRFHLTAASFILLGKWFEYLKAEGVYDNTRIILVSDHGRGDDEYPGNITLPNDQKLQNYNVLLMVKDFYARGELSQSGDFMTNGDTPLLALKDILENPVNPFTNLPLKADKDNGIAITTISALSTYRHGRYTYNIGRNQWLYVKDNVFDPAAWRAAE